MSPKDDAPGFSRRDFLKTAGVSGLAGAVTAAGFAEADAQTGPRVICENRATAASGRAQGFSVTQPSGPHSITKPPSRVVSTMPPRREEASKRVAST